MLVKGEKSLESGDLIQYKTNSKGEIVSVRVLMDISTKDTEAFTTPVENLNTVYGRITKTFADSINVSVNGADETNYKISDEVKIYSVNTKLSGSNKVQTATKDDLAVFDSFDNNRIFLKLYKGIVQEAVIIR